MPLTGQSRRWPRTRLLLKATAILIVAACFGCERDDRANQTDAPAADGSPAEKIDELRSLPYLGYSAEEADPNQSGVTLYDRQRSCSGFGLYSNRRPCSAYLIDASGAVVNSWSDSKAKSWDACTLLPNGDLLVPGSDLADHRMERIGGEARFLLRLSWDGQILWRKPIPAHHDVCATPDGRILTLTFRGLFDEPKLNGLTLRDDLLTLLAEDGAILEERSLKDILDSDQAVFEFQEVQPKDRSKDLWLDLIHANSVEWLQDRFPESDHPLYAPDNVLFCSRHQDTVAIINWGTGRLLWAWGQGQVSGPHDATMLDNGHVLLFDNGLGRGWSRVIELDPLTDTIVWDYKAPEPADFYTASRGGSQRLPNGNTLITESDKGRAFEVTPDGQTVWEFWNPHLNQKGERGTVCRMRRYDPAYIEEILTRVRQADMHEGT